MKAGSSDMSDLPLTEIFAIEVEAQREVMNSALITLETTPTSSKHLEQAMRAAHSLKGAARLVNRDDIVALAHGMEERIIAAQSGCRIISQNDIDALLAGMDIIASTAAELGVNDIQKASIEKILECLANGLVYQPSVSKIVDDSPVNADTNSTEVSVECVNADSQSYLRVEADHMNRLLGLASESLVQTNSFSATTKKIEELKRLHDQISNLLSSIAPSKSETDGPLRYAIKEISCSLEKAELKRAELAEEIENHSSRGAVISQRLYSEVLSGRMRPISDLHSSFMKMTRDVARALDKKVTLELRGQHTLVDREVLKQLETPIQQMLRNAIDHGLENPEERRALGKNEVGRITIEARGTNKTLILKIYDDGRGVDLEGIKSKILARNLSTEELVSKMTDAELYEFMFLPGFSIRDTASEFSGRGVGLDIVHSKIRSLNGNIKVSSKVGEGAMFELHLPISRSVTKALLIDIGASLYAFPLANLVAAVRLQVSDVRDICGVPTITWNNEQISLVDGATALDVTAPETNAASDLAVIIFKSQNEKYGLIVNDFRGQEDLVIQNVDPRFGRLRDVSAMALLHTGEIVVILNCDDLALNISKMSQVAGVTSIKSEIKVKKAQKRILVVDDSITVRELERKLLINAGFEVQIAVDGADGWNELSSNKFDLLVTDLDMPRMNGFELVKMAKMNDRTKNIPVIIISYKERDEDRLKGLEVGADYYLTKGSFHDESFVTAVKDLIGEVNE